MMSKEETDKIVDISINCSDLEEVLTRQPAELNPYFVLYSLDPDQRAPVGAC